MRSPEHSFNRLHELLLFQNFLEIPRAFGPLFFLYRAQRGERKSSLLYKSVVERQITGDSADASAASATLRVSVLKCCSSQRLLTPSGRLRHHTLNASNRPNSIRCVCAS